MNVKVTASNLIDKIMDYYRVSTFTELSNLINIGQPAITKWKKNNSINAIKKKCRELGIYDEIFGDENINNISQNLNIDDNIINLVNTIYGFAKEKNKIDEFKNDLSLLLNKYM